MSTPPSAQPPRSTKPRRKRPADVVSFEDLLAAHQSERQPGQLPPEGVVLIGVDLELQRRMAEGLGLPVPGEGIYGAPNFHAPTPDEPRKSAPELGAPEVGTPNIGAPKISALHIDAPEIGAQQLAAAALPGIPEPPGEPPDDSQFGAPNFGLPDLTALHTGAPIFAAPNFGLDQMLVRRRGSNTPTVHPVSRIEDAFTPAERDLLYWLWDKGMPVPLAQSFRLATGPNGEGARRMAAQAGLIYNTFKNLTRALSTKFALDIVKPEKNLPTIYAVYHFAAILERQRKAGFTGVLHKNGGGRPLVDARIQPAPRRRDLTVDELRKIISAPDFGA